MIGLTISSNAKEVLERLAGGRGAAHEALIKEVYAGALRIQATTKQVYLSGHALRRITGRLSRSIHVTGPTVGGDASGVVTYEANVGTNVKYAAYHEFGFHGTQNVKAFTRQTSTVFGRKLDHNVTQFVKPFSRAVNYDGRPFLRPAATDEFPGITKRIKEAIARAFGGKNDG